MKILYVTGAILALLALLAIIPWIGFWAINTLFAYHIPLTWSTGLAFWVMIGVYDEADYHASPSVGWL